MALPAMKVMRDADTEPEGPIVAVSDVISLIFLNGTPIASAAI